MKTDKKPTKKAEEGNLKEVKVDKEKEVDGTGHDLEVEELTEKKED